MWNILTWCAEYLVSHHFKWQTWPGRGQNRTAICVWGALGSVLWFCSYSGNSASLDVSSWSGSGYSAGLLTSIARNVSISHWEIGRSTQVTSGHSWYHCPERSLRSLVSPNTKENMLTTIYEPSMLLNHPVRCITPRGSSVLLALRQSTQDQSGVHSQLVSGPVIIDCRVSIPTTSLSYKALQSVSSGVLQPVEHLCLLSGLHASNSSQRNAMPLHHAFPSLYQPLDFQTELKTAAYSDITTHTVNGIPV